MTNESALLGLIAELQAKVYTLQAEVTRLNTELAKRPPGDGTAGATVTRIAPPSGGGGSSVALGHGAATSGTTSVALGWPSTWNGPLTADETE